MQKVVCANLGGYSVTPLREVNELLEQGWKVVMMQPFGQIVSVSAVGLTHKESGAYGMTFVLEKE